MSLKENIPGKYGRVVYDSNYSPDRHNRGPGDRWYGKRVYKDPKSASHRRAKKEIDRPKPTWLESLSDGHHVSRNKRDFGGPGY